MSKTSEILDTFFEEANSEWESIHDMQRSQSKAKQALDQAYLERALKIVGEDEPVDTFSSFAQKSIEPSFRNKFRAELRTALTKEWGKK